MIWEWDQVLHLYLPVTFLVIAQLAFLLLPINLNSWRSDLMNAWVFTGLQVLIGGVLFILIPKVFAAFQLSDSVLFFVLVMVFLASWWRVVKVIPFEATLAVTPEHVEQPVVSFESFYNAERLRQLSELSGEDSFTLQRQKALREMLVRRRVDRTSIRTDED